MAFVADSGGQSALLAPTDLLARQHAVVAEQRCWSRSGTRSSCSPGRCRRRSRRRDALELARAPLHGHPREVAAAGWCSWARTRCSASMSRFAELRLAVVDEQHRFGVADREALGSQGRGRARAADDRHAHPPGARADPLRRPGRERPARRAIGPAGGHDGHPTSRGRSRGRGSKVRSEAQAGPSRPSWWCRSSSPPTTIRQASRHRRGASRGVAGRCADEDVVAAISAEAETARLRDLLAPLRVGMVHGRMKAAGTGCRDEPLPRRRAGRAGGHDRARGRRGRARGDR